MASTTPSPADSANIAQAARAAALRSIIISLIINGAIPLVIYLLLTGYTTASQFTALVASGIPSMIHSIVGVIRRKHVDLLAGLVLMGIVISLLLIALGGSPKVYLIRGSFFTAAFGLSFLVSLLLPRPVMFYFARHFFAGNTQAGLARFNSFWQYKHFRRTMRVLSAVWGMGLVLEAVIRISLVIILDVAQFLVISPFVSYGIIAILIIWTFSYNRVRRKSGAELMLRVGEEGQ